MVKRPGRIIVERGARHLGKADQRNSTPAPSPFAPAFALSARSNSRLGFPGEPAVVDATSYKLQAAPTFKSMKPPHATEKGRIETETGQQTAPERENPSGQHAIIPAGLQITGDLVSPGDIHVEGVIHGDITCRTLTLTGQPVIQGTVEAETVRISGTFNGKVQAKKVFLTKAARMAGEIYYEALEMAPGASFEGKLSRLKVRRYSSAPSFFWSALTQAPGLGEAARLAKELLDHCTVHQLDDLKYCGARVTVHTGVYVFIDRPPDFSLRFFGRTFFDGRDPA